jgi:low affinity Fe/Cu permease
VLAAVWVVVGVATGFPRYWEIVLVSVTGITTFVMVFVIQHTQARQVMAMQRKLDEVLRSSSEADNAVIAIEEASDEDLQALGELNFTDRERANGAPSSPSDEPQATQRP